MSVLLGNAIIAWCTQDSRWLEHVSTEGELFICHKGTLAQDDSCCLGKHQTSLRTTLYQQGSRKGYFDGERNRYLEVHCCEGTQAQACSENDPPNYSCADVPSSGVALCPRHA